MFAPGLTTAKDLQKLLFSDQLHANALFYPHFVDALGSGYMTGIKRQRPVVHLSAFISVTYEAHFRLELWSSLNIQGSPPPVCLPSAFTVTTDS